MPDTMLPQIDPLPSATRLRPLWEVQLQRFEARSAQIAVMGLGYVGLPLALALADAGFATTGFDLDPAKLARLTAGESTLRQIPREKIEAAMRSGRFAVSGDLAGLAEADAILICVPTPLGRHREPDLSAVKGAAHQVAAQLRPGQLVVLESTTWPGTTREVVQPILDSSGLVCGHEFFLAYSPEREDPGNPHYDTASIPRVVGGADPHSQRLALALYGAAMRRVVPVSSPQTAEAVKLTENIFRAVNIALVNELKQVYASMGIDVWEVIEAASSKPFGYMPFWPGPGLGGHCIPVDPFYLAWKAKAQGVPTRFVELAGEINTAMPHYVLDGLLRGLDESQGRGLRNSRILVLGVGYKPNLDDVRESPALRLMEMIEQRGGVAAYHDPLVPALPAELPEHPTLAGRRSMLLSDAALEACHAVLIVTDHDAVDYARIARLAPLVVDTRNACARRGVTGRCIIKA
ncbi:nucleotide sugar dehydrogenase [Siccirubricoccus sp. KC 17139]|uniref:Nucleotide sugar dehydrogenase n=1 Tax=Siccirubricoccus soli TaxID=2899147 RepID=A0ABT1D370_9PROT|nr:nucleotide sugar dehydrogenase [Siccirubricoccus soli]MCO6416057.1 nucleotide sugar dehydrogenase [Siccirubricoccus soli]MCP2682189.1 nucleotide sugar dehydrogenase [Siccirubricoccus soli]